MSSPDAGSPNRLARRLSGLVAFCCSHFRSVFIVALLISASCAVYATQAFEISTDLDSLLASNLPWRAEAQRLEHAFPDQAEDITLVVGGATPELTEQATAALVQALQSRRDLFSSVERINGGAFFDQEGLLFLPVSEVRRTTENMIAAQPLLGPVAADPSLRGLFQSLDAALSGASDPARRGQLARAVSEILRVARQSSAGEPAYLSWRSLLTEEQEAPLEWRQFVELMPRLDFSSAMPGAKATGAIRRAINALELNEQQGVHVRITGTVPISDEELSTLTESSGPIALLMLVCLVWILYAATRSIRAVVAMLATVCSGAIITGAIGLAVLGRFNLISIAFLPLFFGLGVDFCIQFCVRARADAPANGVLTGVLPSAAGAIGSGLALAAAAIAAGFFAFLPTAYRGVSELGFVAGIGMAVALVLSLTLLPALLVLLNARNTPQKTAQGLQGADNLIRQGRWIILIAAALAALIACIVLPGLRFDFDPMRLRNPRTEAVATYYELAQNIDTTPNTINVPTANLEDAARMTRRLASLHEVGEASSLQSFIPDDQAAKLALIADARSLLDFTLNPFEVAPPPSDAELVLVLREEATRLRALESVPSTLRVHLGSLAAMLDSLSTASPGMRAHVSQALMRGAPTAIAQIRISLTAEPISAASFPPSLRRRWLAPNGLALVEASPAQPLRDMDATMRFVNAVTAVAPNASGDAVTIVRAGQTILSAFATAGLLSALAITLLLAFALKRLKWTSLTAIPVLLAGLLTFATCALTGISINLENMIALPLLFGIGVAFNIYFVVAWRSGQRLLLGSSLSMAILFSALTTGTSFAALTLSAHPGTASMGALLLIALAWIAVTSLVLTPAMLSVAAAEEGES